MGYTKTNWVTGTTPISAANLNNLEKQYDEACAYADSLLTSVIPSGLVMMWDGLIANIPAGFVLCDGNNGTLNRLNHYPVSIPNAVTNPGVELGSNSKTTEGHAHTQGNTGASGSHAHSLIIQADGGHKHSLGYTAVGYNYGESGINVPHITTDTVSDHNHSGSSAQSSGAHAHSISDTDSKADTIADVRPLSLTTAFVMKT